MQTAFLQAPIGAKVMVDLSMGIMHVGRKFSQTEVIEFSRKRGGWNIVSPETFSGGKPISVREGGRLPSQAEMLTNQRAYADRKYSALNFNCDDGAEVLAGEPPRSPQRKGAVTGGVIGFTISRAFEMGPIGTFLLTVGSTLAGIAVANATDAKHTPQPSRSLNLEGYEPPFPT